MTRPTRAVLPTLALRTLTVGALVLPLAACVDNNAPADAAEAITVDSTADACTVSAVEAPSGKLTFTITNSGDDVTEFYLLADDKLRVVSELENIGPGLTRDLVVQAAPGDYYTACKPGMVGDGITAAFTVTDSGADVGPTGALADQLAEAETSYVAYVKDQVGSLVTGTQQFADAYTSGDDDTARSLYAGVRAHWERIEPVAESFGDLDPLLDAREADLAEGDEWSGWHYIEKDLWQPDAADNGGEAYTALTADQRQAAADQLVELTGELEDRVTADDFTFQAFQISNGAKELLDEVATGKVTGEEEIWSHTDLWDFRANVDGAEVGLGVLRGVAEQEDPDLVAQLDDRFAALDDLLAQYGSIDDGFVYYDELTADQVAELAAAVDAVSEPLSHLTAVITDAS
ncbi:iron uptake system protein EfeO [Cellulomonas sp. RIT-PI-Y]|uniref:iron uptake system protein EfeO n=1 Tax=Cellulomonas sp. RIT-PI-Y TaxID=3035297 RepID=UPI0021D9C2FD|nr:iron uptake system protein EfeO [Cellulomonas sp. RIT-PI-Y]